MIDFLALVLENVGPNAKGCPVFEVLPEHIRSKWYLSPRQHVLELLVIYSIFFPLLFWTMSKIKNTTHGTIQNTNGLIAKFLGVACIGSFMGLIYYKMHSPYAWRTFYIFQPCHLILLIWGISLLYVHPTRQQVIFQVCTSLSWAAVLAFMFPDMSDYEYFGDVANFYIEHILMLLVPLVLSLKDKFTYNPRWEWVLFTYCLITLYHFVALQSVAILFEVNIATMMFPPKALGHLGIYYRPLGLLSVFLVHVLYNGLLYLIVLFSKTKIKNQ